ncbi:N-succinylarginine dihydrolase [Altericroceibacterium endophyticum]|uniref:N-succinylarginine dihydrolase n=1 Tax=Altericroceibacterium endophyticum TaxID=1808508 RepID=A0A6I4T8G2_9SPHN|nr:N-succinylarginine dihydrolase [Altericroceibacterium endophyticum]MXO66789.1 N-succinylarginine dihydrolase [Altericroceibacterium endophyticum]
MSLVEVNFDGLIGPSHNYAGLSLGNLAATRHAGDTAHPRAAALQGLEKMRGNMERGLVQGFFLPLPRPNRAYLDALSADASTDRGLIAGAWSASSMWTANAATVSPAPDTTDGRCHLSVANLVTMPHRAHEWPDTLRQLRLAFADQDHFAVHGPVPPSFGDEGAANHMRLCSRHGASGVEIFVYGRSGGPFPARQHEQASRIIARRHGLSAERAVFIEQNPDAIAAGAFHNDVVAVANEQVLFCHEQAFAQPQAAYDEIRQAFPELELVEVPASAVSLAEAIKSYLFNAQLLSLPGGEMALVIPTEAWDSAPVRGWLEAMLAGNGPIRQVIPVDVRQSMANGGGPACLRLRVVADPATIDPRFLLTSEKADAMAEIIATSWPEALAPAAIGDKEIAAQIEQARSSLIDTVGLTELA